MSPSPLTLADLLSCFLSWLENEFAAGRCARRTVNYYRDQLGKFVNAVGGKCEVAALKAYDLERTKKGWHSVQAVQRLFNWAVNCELISRNPFARVERPRPGQRQRILTDRQSARLLGAARPAFRRFMLGLRETLARPQEVRAFTWEMLDEGLGCFVLTDFKGKRRRRDQARVRLVPISPRLLRLLERLRGGQTEGHVFLNQNGQPWTRNAVRCAMRRLRRRLGWPGQGEHVVCYTFRHTGATRATANGVSDRRLAELLGHTSTRTTARYQHLQADHLRAALDQAQGRLKG